LPNSKDMIEIIEMSKKEDFEIPKAVLNPGKSVPN
jgi:hypothetical protein